MKKVRVLRELPFANVGDEVFNVDGLFNFGSVTFSLVTISFWVSQGWMEWVKEEDSLEEKLRNHYNSQLMRANFSEYAQIAKEHFENHPEEIGCVKKEEIWGITDSTGLFASIKSDVSACICRALCTVNGHINSNALNEMANKYTDRVIQEIRRRFGKK